MLPNRAEHVLADLGALHAGGVPVTFYATLAAEQVAFMAGDCDARIAVLDGAAELARWQPVLAQLPGAAARSSSGTRPPARPASSYLTLGTTSPRWAASGCAAEPEAVAGRVAAIRPGRPGHPAVHLGHHRQPQGRAASPTATCCTRWPRPRRSATSSRHVRWVSYLPLAHIAERMFTHLPARLRPAGT